MSLARVAPGGRAWSRPLLGGHRAGDGGRTWKWKGALVGVLDGSVGRSPRCTQWRDQRFPSHHGRPTAWSANVVRGAVAMCDQPIDSTIRTWGASLGACGPRSRLGLWHRRVASDSLVSSGLDQPPKGISVALCILLRRPFVQALCPYLGITSNSWSRASVEERHVTECSGHYMIVASTSTAARCPADPPRGRDGATALTRPVCSCSSAPALQPRVHIGFDDGAASYMVSSGGRAQSSALCIVLCVALAVGDWRHARACRVSWTSVVIAWPIGHALWTDPGGTGGGTLMAFGSDALPHEDWTAVAAARSAVAYDVCDHQRSGNGAFDSVRTISPARRVAGSRRRWVRKWINAIAHRGPTCMCPWRRAPLALLARTTPTTADHLAGRVGSGCGMPGRCAGRLRVDPPPEVLVVRRLAAGCITSYRGVVVTIDADDVTGKARSRHEDPTDPTATVTVSVQPQRGRDLDPPPPPCALPVVVPSHSSPRGGSFPWTPIVCDDGGSPPRTGSPGSSGGKSRPRSCHHEKHGRGGRMTTSRHDYYITTLMMLGDGFGGGRGVDGCAGTLTVMTMIDDDRDAALPPPILPFPWPPWTPQMVD